jgi:hypothetical protein
MALTKITANVIEAGAISTASLADTSITADKLAATLDLTGKAITVATASAGDNDTTVASTAFVTTAIANLTDSAPAALDTLNELAAALNDDANFSTTVTNSIATKLPLAGGTLTGDLNFGDSDKAIFGAGSDLEIYHDGSNSYIKDAGTGSLRLRGTDLRLESSTLAHNFIICSEGGGVSVFHNDSSKLSTTSTGINVTGTATMDGLTVDGAGTAVFSGGQYIRVDGNAAGFTDLEPVLWARSKVGASVSQINVKGSQWQFGGGGTLDANPAMTIDYASGDISFYEDTGTTAKFFWDASAESLGIGTTSPQGKLTVSNGSGAQFEFFPENSTDTNLFMNYDRTSAAYQNLQTRAATHQFLIGASEKMRLDSSGNVGIGTNAATAKLHVKNSANDDDNILLVEASGTTTYGVYLKSAFSGQMGRVGALSQSDGGLDGASIAFEDFGRDIAFRTNEGSNNSEKARILKSGEFGIGTSSPNANLHVLSSGNGEIEVERASGALINLQAQSAKGVIGTDSNHDLQLKTNASVRMTITNTGNVGIGTTSPNRSNVNIHGANRTLASTTSQLAITTSDAVAADIGGSLHFGAHYDTGADFAPTGYIAGRRETATTNNYAGYLQFGVTQGGAATIEAMRITSAGKVGIGTSSPSTELHVASSSGYAELRLQGASGSSGSLEFYDSTTLRGDIFVDPSSNIIFRNTSEAMRIDSSGNVGIGQSSPNNETNRVSLELNDTWGGVFQNSVSGTPKSEWRWNTSGFTVFGSVANEPLVFITNNAERMRIDSSGNLLVGTTNVSLYNSSSEVGTRIGDGVLMVNRSGLTPAYFNRLSDDGTIVDLRKDGTTVGSIGVANGNNLTVGGSVAAHIGLQFGTGIIYPTDNTGAANDNAVALGDTNNRFTNLFLSGNSYANTYRHDGDSDTYFNFPAENQLSLVGGGATIAKAYYIAGAYGVLELHGSGSATYPNYTFNGDSNTGMYRATTDTLAFTTGGSERMRIDSSGNVGIGTSSPDVPLEVVSASPTNGIVADFVNSTNAGGTTAAIKLSNADSEACDVVLGANRVGANFGSDFFISLSDSVDGSNQERFRITEAGNVGIGTTSPSEKLEIAGAASATSTGIAIKNGSATRLRIFHNDNAGASFITSHDVQAAQTLFIGSGNNLLLSGGGGTEHARIDSGGKVGIGTSSPATFLDINSGNVSPVIRLTSSAVGQIPFRLVANIPGVSNSGFSIVDETANANRLVINSSGNVGIGTTPSSEFHVKGDADTIARIEPNNNSGKGTLLVSSASSGDGGMQYDANANRMYLFSYGDMSFNVGTGNLSGNYPANERMRIDTSGNTIVENLYVTADSSATLSSATKTIIGQDNIEMYYQSSQRIIMGRDQYTSGNAGLVFLNPGYGRTEGGVVIGSTGRGIMGFSTSNNTSIQEAMRIDASQSIFINTTSGYGTPGYSNMWIQHSTGRQRGIAFKATSTSSTDTPLLFFNGGAGVAGQITYTYSATTYSTSSDYRLKENVVYDWDAITRLKQLKPCRFNWIADETDTPIDGFIAHEAAEVVPNSVIGEKDAIKDAFLDADGNEIPGSTIDAQTMDHAKLVPLLTKALQEQQTIIESLEARITALES